MGIEKVVPGLGSIAIQKYRDSILEILSSISISVSRYILKMYLYLSSEILSGSIDYIAILCQTRVSRYIYCRK